ncbi:MAG: hypothetical protein K6T80_00990 [Firmicutes bacterium]|nr:hypothetical protein [Bacillota bacterium]
MFFATWWQGLIFGIVTTVALLAIGYAFTAMWKPYEEEKKKVVWPHEHGHDGHDTHGAHDSNGCHAHH